jgi:hypothetical protein
MELPNPANVSCALQLSLSFTTTEGPRGLYS